MAQEASIEELLDCMICCNRLKSPRMFTCQHMLCFNCLGQYIGSKLFDIGDNGLITLSKKAKVEDGDISITFNCPKCNEQISCRRVSDIKKSLLGNQLLDTLKSKKSATQELKVCKNDSQDAVFECITCDQPFCKKCFEHEDCQSLSHIVGKIIDTTDISCMVHGLELDYQCIDCNKCICLDCYLDHHTKHKAKKISSIGSELRDKFRQCVSLADGNDDDSKKLREDFAKIEDKHLVCASDALKEWNSLAAQLFCEGNVELFMQEEGELAESVASIRKDVEAVNQRVENVTSKLKGVQDNNLRFMVCKTEIENIHMECNSQEIKMLELKRKIEQKKNIDVLKQLKEQLLQKLGSLIDNDIEKREKNKQSKDQAQGAKVDLSQTKSKGFTFKARHQNGNPLQHTTPTGTPTGIRAGIPTSSALPNAMMQPHSDAPVAMARLRPMPRLQPRAHANRPFSTSPNEGMQSSPAALAQSWTLNVVQNTLAKEPASVGNSGSPSHQTYKHRAQRLNLPQSVSSPHQLHNPGYEPSAVSSIRQSGSDQNLARSGAGGRYHHASRGIVIRDPNQGGKDVTDEILRSRKK